MRALLMLAVAALTWAAAPTGTSAAPDTGTRPADAPPLHPLLRELDGRTFTAVGTFDDVLGGPTDLYRGATLRLTFRDGSATASTSCGENVYPALVVGPSDNAAVTPIDFGRPSGPGCRMGPDGIDIPTGTLLWVDGGQGRYSVGNGYFGLDLVEAGPGPGDVTGGERTPLTGWLVASGVAVLLVLLIWLVVRWRFRDRPADRSLS